MEVAEMLIAGTEWFELEDARVVPLVSADVAEMAAGCCCSCCCCN